MFSYKNKLNKDLKNCVDNNFCKSYRVIIYCKSIPETIENKIKRYNGKIINTIPYINCINALVSSNIIERLIEFPQVNYITFDNPVFLCASSVYAANNIQINHNIKHRLSGKNIGIGLVDTGAFPHPDITKPISKIKKFVDIINDYNYPYDDNGHGTFISGILCGNGYSSKNMYKGIAENSHLYVVKAFNSIGYAYTGNVLYGINKIIEESEKFNIKIICLPFESIDMDTIILSMFEKLFKIAAKKNIVVVVPSGHNGNNKSSLKGIATLKNCITVAGIDTSSNYIKPYIYSSSGPWGNLEKPDLAAACVNICSLKTDTKYIPERNGMKLYPKRLNTPYTNFTGTSCAAAFIAGICALLFENDPELSFKDVLSLLKTSCNLLDMYKWKQGAGIIDIKKLLPKY